MMYTDERVAHIQGYEAARRDLRTPNLYSLPDLAHAWLSGFFERAFEDAYGGQPFWVH